MRDTHLIWKIRQWKNREENNQVRNHLVGFLFGATNTKWTEKVSLWPKTEINISIIWCFAFSKPAIRWWCEERGKIEGLKHRWILTISTSIFIIPRLLSNSRMLSFAVSSCVNMWWSSCRITRSKLMGLSPPGYCSLVATNGIKPTSSENLWRFSMSRMSSRRGTSSCWRWGACCSANGYGQMLDRLADRFVSELFRYSSMLISGFSSTWPEFQIPSPVF